MTTALLLLLVPLPQLSGGVVVSGGIEAAAPGAALSFSAAQAAALETDPYPAAELKSDGTIGPKMLPEPPQ